MLHVAEMRRAGTSETDSAEIAFVVLFADADMPVVGKEDEPFGIIEAEVGQWGVEAAYGT